MILSRAEIAATLQKAARGQGMALGHIDMFVPAAVRALAGNNCADEVTRALAGPHGAAQFKKARVAIAGPIALDAVMCGAAQVRLEMVDAPCVLESMVQNINDHSSVWIDAHVNGADVILSVASRKPIAKRTVGPIDIPDNAWAKWCDWAAETYVPETALSRLGGAGAGLTDND